MTEKQYGGNTGRGTEKLNDRVIDGKKVFNEKNVGSTINNSSIVGVGSSNKSSDNNKLKSSDSEKIIEAGKISIEIREYAKKIAKKDTPLLEIAEKIEQKILELGGKPAFPVNLSINKIAAHYTPSHDDKTLASGLLKIDFGVHVDGFTADNALSVDLENSKENKKLIEASEKALENAINLIKLKVNADIKNGSGEGGRSDSSETNPNNLKLNEIGKTIQETIESYGFSPVINLSGHSIEKYNLHSGITIPNTDDEKEIMIKNGLYAIEPFTTTGSGRVHEGAPSGIYELINEKQPRSTTARKILMLILQEYKTLPFCSRWIFKKFGASGLFALKELESNGNLHHFPQLVETQNSVVSQAEHTILIENGKVSVVTM